MNPKLVSPNNYSLKIKNRLNAQADREDVNLPFSASTTDRQAWRLVVEKDLGRLKWKYLSSQSERDSRPQNVVSRFFLGLPLSVPEFEAAKSPSQSISNGLRFHSRLQVAGRGCWADDLKCIVFVTPMLIMSWYITGAEIDEAYAIELVNYLFSIQDPTDGGFPTYIGGKTTLMGTMLIYVALRLIGIPSDEERLAKARTCFLKMGGAAYLPSWAKFWFSLLGLYEWEGTDPYPVEVWLLPEWTPISPWRWFNIVRQVYLPMCYLSSRRFTIPSNPLIDEIKTELFTEQYSSLNFASLQGTVLECERHQPQSRVLRTVNWALSKVWNPWLRPRALAENAEQRALAIIKASDNTFNGTGLISVDCFLNMIVFYCEEGPNSKKLKQNQDRSLEYLWFSPQGMQVQSIHGAHAWETSLALQTFVMSGLSEHPDLRSCTEDAYKFLLEQQLLEDWPDSPPCHRPSRLGGWPFTTRYSGSTCSDCTGEALKAILLLESQTNIPRLSTEQNIRLGIDNLLMIQNASGGYSAFEPILSGPFLECLNGTELFANVMTEHDYTECTSSCITALSLFRKRDGTYRAEEVVHAIDRGVDFIHQNQHFDGGWLASWGIAYTYGAFFAMEALHCVNETYENHAVVKRGCDFILDKQKEDGGWGETIESILQKTYIQAESSHVVQTAWCCIALIYADYPDPEPIRRGIQLIMSRQKPNGEWEQEAGVGAGIFTCQLFYYNYIYCFPIRAIALYREKYGDDKLL
ncbi:terpenoid cyclases/protein prenyltransferase alpha-alpha toroid [Aspergillus pseudotamarii]|uniref:Terpene cyclase/mutase family member n=1 Tax=Aspergillus pseudotamarii TaxID=132259 RepID=A0A5N6SYP2_ASPPS|nr:terpenoid cyclases/protein prenyltransferase alpha-alpha toroid [Aspergillus pseudotamarii]KAE8138899.1 terpenoid cyclases/protein prenyltransferase alpha-alpha toroid [Aspergillus pseudotamarii]